jgi:hypothetical protein
MSKTKYAYEQQEEVVSALWDFAHDQQTKAMNCSSIPTKQGDYDITRVNLDAVGDALKKIMKTFGYEVMPVE